jgi:hypothetical protein
VTQPVQEPTQNREASRQGFHSRQLFRRPSSYIVGGNWAYAQFATPVVVTTPWTATPLWLTLEDGFTNNDSMYAFETTYGRIEVKVPGVYSVTASVLGTSNASGPTALASHVADQPVGSPTSYSFDVDARIRINANQRNALQLASYSYETLLVSPTPRYLRLSVYSLLSDATADWTISSGGITVVRVGDYADFTSWP